jgi:ribokinase
METVLRAAELAIANKTKVILNPAPARILPPALLQKVDVLVANETEVLVLTGAEDLNVSTAAAACRPLLEAGVESVITTLGREGALITAGVGATRVPGFKVKAVDTTAAGDTFTGALGAALAEGRSLEDAVGFANAAAALACTKHGAQVSIPTRAEVDQMLAEGVHS